MCSTQLQAETATQLASLRFSDLFAYWDIMEYADDKAKGVIRSYREKLVGVGYNGTNNNIAGSIQADIYQRNVERNLSQLLEYPYMQPVVMPNSIAI